MNKLTSFSADNKGAALLTVVIAMLFVVALGVALLSTSYMGYAVTVAQKQEKSNFYSAETAMDQLRTGIHDVVSDSLATAYTDTLKKNLASDDAKAANFSTVFFSSFQNAKLSNQSIVSYTDNVYTYSPTAFQSYLDTLKPADSTVSVSPTVADGAANITQSASAITLKGIRLEFVDAKGFKSIVTTDIVIKYPKFTGSAALPYELNKYTLVANTALKCSSENNTITGSVYAGAVNCTGTGELSIKSGDLFSRGNVTLTNGSTFKYEGNSSGTPTELWAKGLILNGTGGSTLNIAGSLTKTYIANDLLLQAPNVNVVLEGNYTGFGSKSASTSENTTDKDASSSILVYGRNESTDAGSTLDLSNLISLQLAGISYIAPTTDVDGKSDGPSIPMGQSIALKSDQLAYLVPVTCLGTSFPSNPYIYTSTGKSPSLTVLYNSYNYLWPNSTVDSGKYSRKTLTDYLGSFKSSEKSATDASVTTAYNFANGKVQIRYKALDNTNTAAYVFIVFNNQSAANNYFRDYFASDPTKAKQYFQNYLGYFNLPSKNVKSQGNAYAGNAGSTIDSTTKKSVYSSDNVTLQTAGSVFAATCQSSFDTRSAPSNSPYVRFVPDPDSITGPMLFYSGTSQAENKNLVAIVTNEAIDIQTYNPKKYPNLKFLVSTENITISNGHAFIGYIISGGTVTVRDNITQPTNINPADYLSATTYAGVPLSKYIASGSTGTKSTADSWNIDELVVYQNWNKG